LPEFNWQGNLLLVGWCSVSLFGGWFKWEKQSWVSSCDYRADGKVSIVSEIIKSFLLVIYIYVDIYTCKHLTKTQPVNLLFFFFIFWGGVGLRPLGMLATNWSIVSVPDDRWVWTIWWNVKLQGKVEYSRENLPQCNFVHKFHMT
jgi:hypothetical protein